MRSNPLFSNIAENTGSYADSDASTMKGAAFKTLFLLLITAIVAVVTAFYMFEITDWAAFSGVLIASAIIGFIAVIVGRVSFRYAKFCGLIYACCEGLFLGALTLTLELLYPGIGFIAIIGTAIVFLVTLVVYVTKLAGRTSMIQRIGLVMIISFFPMMISYLILSAIIPGFANNLLVYIVVSAFLLIYGAISLIMDFDYANSLVAMGVDKDAEWSVALGMAVTLIYIYVQILRIAAVIMSKKD